MVQLVILACGAVLGFLAGAVSPQKFEAGATCGRGRLLGLKKGLICGAAVIGVLFVLNFSALWTAVVVGATALVSLLAYHGTFLTPGEEKMTKPQLALGGVLDCLVITTFCVYCYQLGLSYATIAIIMGLLGGFLAGGVFAGGLMMDFFQGLKPYGHQNFSSDSSYNGMLLSVAVLGACTTAFGPLPSLAVFLGSLGTSFAAGVLTATGKYRKRQTA